MPTYIIDDEFGDSKPGASSNIPVYSPAQGQWDPVGGTCDECTLVANLPYPIDFKQAQRSTWHSTTVSPDEPETTITMSFTGTAVRAYCLLPPDFGPYITSYMNVTFQLDGEVAGSFEATAAGTDWSYDSMVFSKSGLENKQHTFVVQPRADVNTSYIVFDYIAYDTPDDVTSTENTAPAAPPSSSPSTSPAPIPSSTLSSSSRSGPTPVSPHSSSSTDLDPTHSASFTAPASMAPVVSTVTNGGTVMVTTIVNVPIAGSSSSGGPQPSTSVGAGHVASSNSSLSKTTTTIVAVCATLGGLGILALTMLAMWWVRRKRKLGRARWIHPFTGSGAGVGAAEAGEAPTSADNLILDKPSPFTSARQGASSASAASLTDGREEGSTSRPAVLSAAVAHTRAVHDAHVERVREMERTIAAFGDMQDGETANLRRELDHLREEVRTLSEALRVQTEELRRAAAGYGEPPPLYEEASQGTSNFGRV